MSLNQATDSAHQPITQPQLSALGALIVALALVLTFVLWPKPVPISDVRVLNASSHTLHDVVVAGTHYGDLAPGQVSTYVAWGPAYSLERISFEVDGRRLLQQPEDHTGPSLGPGHFTYRIRLDGSSPIGEFTATSERDE
jgi:hypothetical protein